LVRFFVDDFCPVFGTMSLPGELLLYPCLPVRSRRKPDAMLTSPNTSKQNGTKPLMTVPKVGHQTISPQVARLIVTRPTITLVMVPSFEFHSHDSPWRVMIHAGINKVRFTPASVPEIPGTLLSDEQKKGTIEAPSSVEEGGFNCAFNSQVLVPAR
jgi:hypothetical protein